jgi:hypothetical protein
MRRGAAGQLNPVLPPGWHCRKSTTSSRCEAAHNLERSRSRTQSSLQLPEPGAAQAQRRGARCHLAESRVTKLREIRRIKDWEDQRHEIEKSATLFELVRPSPPPPYVSLFATGIVLHGCYRRRSQRTVSMVQSIDLKCAEDRSRTLQHLVMPAHFIFSGRCGRAAQQQCRLADVADSSHCILIRDSA